MAQRPTNVHTKLTSYSLVYLLIGIHFEICLPYGLPSAPIKLFTAEILIQPTYLHLFEFYIFFGEIDALPHRHDVYFRLVIPERKTWGGGQPY